MKYIRTEDGVYKITNEDLTKYYVENNHYCIDELTHVVISGAYEKTDKTIKVANTIEELCDGFYNDSLNDFDCFGFDGLYIYNDFESFKNDWNGYRTHDNWKGDGYGFIKTSKGLIYVAKLNRKGELELICKQ